MADSARTALVAGATGLVGRALVQQLCARPDYRQILLWVRKPPAGLPTDSRLVVETVDFDRLHAASSPHESSAAPHIDDAYIALGTTIAAAGSQAAFRRVDFDAVVDVARAAKAAGARRIAVVSALGADRRSRVFYNRVKGEMQDAVAALGGESVVFAQPSLLLGERATLGQPVRRGEVWAERLFGPSSGPLRGLVPKGWRPIEATDVAAALIDATLHAAPGVRILGSAAMQGAAGSR